MKKLLNIGLVLLIIASAIYVFKDPVKRQFFKPNDSSIEQVEFNETLAQKIETVATELDIPWGIAFLPDGDMLVTERKGTLRRIGQNGQKYTIEGVKPTSEGGLLGITLHPNFASNSFIYLYSTTQDGEALKNRVERYVYKDDKLQDRKVLLDDIPGAAVHDGGRLAFGPDGFLYVATGDAAKESNAQDKESLAGKILRMTDDGKIPTDNPFGNYTYSYGHRNPQGLAWDDEGRLWSTEHGPSGVETGNDELNLIEKGGNYGWPAIRGMEFAEGMKPPVAESGKGQTWAPASLAYNNGHLYFAGLRGQSLYRAQIKSEAQVSLRSFLRSEFGRLRTVHVHKGSIYILTSNTDGRGDPKPGDDRILRIPFSALE